MTLDTLEMAQAMRRSGLPQEQADTIAEQIGKGLGAALASLCLYLIFRHSSRVLARMGDVGTLVMKIGRAHV